jgi:hypothetical protein
MLKNKRNFVKSKTIQKLLFFETVSLFLAMKVKIVNYKLLEANANVNVNGDMNCK